MTTTVREIAVALRGSLLEDKPHRLTDHAIAFLLDELVEVRQMYISVCYHTNWKENGKQGPKPESPDNYEQEARNYLGIDDVWPRRMK